MRYLPKSPKSSKTIRLNQELKEKYSSYDVFKISKKKSKLKMPVLDLFHV